MTVPVRVRTAPPVEASGVVLIGEKLAPAPKEWTMPDKSPQKPSPKKPGKSLREKRAEKKLKHQERPPLTKK